MRWGDVTVAQHPLGRSRLERPDLAARLQPYLAYWEPKPDAAPSAEHAEHDRVNWTRWVGSGRCSERAVRFSGMRGSPAYKAEASQPSLRVSLQYKYLLC